MNIPQKVKADLWEAKHSISSPASAAQTDQYAANSGVRVRPGAHGGDCVYFTDPFRDEAAEYGGHMAEAVLGDENQIAIEKDYWQAYAKAKRQHRTENMVAAAMLSLWGFPAGIIVWLFYRLIRFAVKG
jgi:hypothetical protein